LGRAAPAPCWRQLERLERGELASPFYVRLEVDDRTGVLARVAGVFSDHGVSVARLVQEQNGDGAVLHIVTHEARTGDVEQALGDLERLEETHGRLRSLRVISDRGVEGLGWA